MSKRPIVNGIEISGFLPPFIRELRDAIREDRKSQTRRVIKPQPKFNFPSLVMKGEGKDEGYWKLSPNDKPVKCPYGKPGQIRALREPLVNIGDYACYADDDPPTNARNTFFPHDAWKDPQFERTGIPGYLIPWRWKVNTLSQLYMPYEAARTFVRISNLRAERLQDISECDAKSEGTKKKYIYDPANEECGGYSYRMAFADLWDSINSDRGYPWEANDWVWVVVMERIQT